LQNDKSKIRYKKATKQAFLNSLVYNIAIKTQKITVYVKQISAIF